MIFDMDGLLLDTQNMYSAVSKQLLAEHGKQPDFDFKMKVGCDKNYQHHNYDQGDWTKGRGGGRDGS